MFGDAGFVQRLYIEDITVEDDAWRHEHILRQAALLKFTAGHKITEAPDIGPLGIFGRNQFKVRQVYGIHKMPGLFQIIPEGAEP